MTQYNSLNVKLSNSQFNKLKSAIKNESVLIPLGLTAAASAADAGIHQKILRSGHNTTLTISNDERKDIL